MNNIKILQKIRTYVKNEGMVNLLISDELNNKDNTVRKRIHRIESYPTNSLKNKPIRFVFFKYNNFYILLKSKYLDPSQGDGRIGNFITHTLVLTNKVNFFNPIDYIDSNCFKLDISNTLPKQNLSLFDLINSIPQQENNIFFSKRNKQLLLALIEAYKENKHLITISNNINPILKELIYLLPPDIRQDITFSNLEFSKISEDKVYNIYNYSDYSLNLSEMNSYKNFSEIMDDAKKINYLCFNYEDSIFSTANEMNKYVDFIFTKQSNLDMFYSFAEKYNYSLNELDLLTLLFEYEVGDIDLTLEELENIIDFVKKQNNAEYLKKLFILIRTKQNYNYNFRFLLYFLESFNMLFSKEEFVEILYNGIEKALYDETYDIDLLFKKLFKIYYKDIELRLLHKNFIESLVKKNNSKRVSKNILTFNAYSFDILQFELKNHYFEFIANTDKNTLIALIEFYEDKRFPKSLILVKYNQQNMQKYLFRLLENKEFSIWDLANHNMNKDIKAYFKYKQNEIISKNFLKKIIPFQKDELSLLEEFSKKLNTQNDIISDLVKVVISNNKLNFTILVKLYKSYAIYNEENKELIFQHLNNILEKKFSKYYDKVDFLHELHINILPYPYLLTGWFIHNINNNVYINFINFRLEENMIPLEIIKKKAMDKKILKIIQKQYNRTQIDKQKIVFEDLFMLRVFN